jgi:xanthine dehydrogenase/oxidase
MIEFLSLIKTLPSPKIVVGNTEVGIEVRFGKKEYQNCISPLNIAELNHVILSKENLRIGSAISLTNIMEILESYLIKSNDKSQSAVFHSIVDQLKWFSGPAIRNVACLGGNIATASPISDLNPVFMALNAQFVLQSLSDERKIVTRSVAAQNFFLGYRKTDLKPGEAIVEVVIPFPGPNSYIKSMHQKRRREDDIAIITSCFATTLSSNNKIASFSSAFGGIGITTKRFKEVDDFLVGKEWTLEVFNYAMKILSESAALVNDVPGGMPEFRTSLCLGFLYKFFLNVQEQHFNTLPAHLSSAIGTLSSHTFPQSSQRIETSVSDTKMYPVGQSVLHSSAEKQVNGTAVYTTDIPKRHNELSAALVTSTIPHGKVLSVDASKAILLPGVFGFFSAKDIPGVNKIGDIVMDEEIFATEFVVNVGQPIGCIVAETEAIAKKAASLVKVEYEEITPMLSLEEAVDNQQFYELYNNSINNGDLAQGFKTADHVVEGQIKIGGQEHFYFEPQTSLVEHSEGEYKVHTSSQNLKMTQLMIAKALGIDANKVVVSSKRIGGGFGGKETQFVYSCIAAIAAFHTKRPIRILLSRDEDMKITGHRHPFMGKYKVGFNKDGKVKALDVQYYNNGGSSYDLSGPVIERAMLHADNAYNIPNIKVTGRIAKTNLVSNTAFRGFGGPQGTLVAEHWIEHVANHLKIAPETVRAQNLYKPGDRTHFKMEVKTDYEKMFKTCMDKIDFITKRAEIEIFNKQNKHKKKGLAIVPSKFGLSFTFASLNQGSALVHIYTDGSVLISHGGVEMGQGLHTKCIQVAAKELGISIDKIHIAETSTDKVANSSATAASMGSDIYGMATHYACQELNQRLAPLREKYPEKSWGDIIKQAWLDRIDLSARGFTKVPTTGWNWSKAEGQPFHYFTSGVAASEVIIDTLTGDHRILSTEIVFDIGKSINPTIDIGQIEGAFIQGYGWMTLEELIWGDKDHKWVKPGHMLTAGPGNYKIPSIDDIPRNFNITLVNASENSQAIHSSRGVGEPPLLLSASVVFALRDAVAAARKDYGKDEFFQLNLPLTAERIRMACADEITELCVKESYGRGDHSNFQARGSW